MSRVREERDFPLRPRGWEREERAGGQRARARCARFAPACHSCIDARWATEGAGPETAPRPRRSLRLRAANAAAPGFPELLLPVRATYRLPVLPRLGNCPTVCECGAPGACGGFARASLRAPVARLGVTRHGKPRTWTAGVVWCVRGRYLFVPVAMLGGARGGPFMAVCGPFAWLSARVTPRE